MPSIPVEPIRRPEGLFPGELFVIAWTEQLSDPSELFEEERMLVDRAMAKRRKEFATGRVLARKAVRHLGVEPAPILRDESGAPIWGRDIVGSISHTEGMVAAVATRLRFARGVGVDVECRQNPFPWRAIDSIALPEERAWLDSLPDGCRELAAYVLFSAKESAIKCLYTAAGSLARFNDLAVRMDFSSGVFVVDPTYGSALNEVRLVGRLGWNDTHIFTGVWWPAPDYNS